MKKKALVILLVVFVISTMLISVSHAAEKESFGAKMQSFWRNIFGYPARVTEESASVIADTGKRSVSVVTTEVKRVGEVTSGDVAKTKELVTEPITGTAETAVKAVEGTSKIPSEAMKEKTQAAPAQAETK